MQTVWECHKCACAYSRLYSQDVEGSVLSEGAAVITGLGNVLSAGRRYKAEYNGSDLLWTSPKFGREYICTTDAGRFSATAVDGKNLMMRDRNYFQCNTVLGA